jgi:hypothetical protein
MLKKLLIQTDAGESETAVACDRYRYVSLVAHTVPLGLHCTISTLLVELFINTVHLGLWTVEQGWQLRLEKHS